MFMQIGFKMKLLICLFAFIFSVNLFAQNKLDFSKVNMRKTFGKYKGCIVIKKEGDTSYITNSHKIANTRYSPCSTFKIPNSLIGLETGVLNDENQIFKWDSLPKYLEEWNKDHDLKSAIKYSVVWYYQELARQVGEERMKFWIDTLKYGNRDISGGIDKFWLNSSLKISALEQLAFIERLYTNKLPFSERNINIVKSIIIQDSTDKYVFSGKTGSKDNFGWFVGSILSKGERYYFVLNIQGDGAYGLRAKEMIISILKDLELIY